MKLYLSDTNFDSEEHIKNWLFRIAINDAKNFVKSRWNTYLPYEEKLCDISFTNNQSDNSYIYRKLMKLSDKYRIVLLLYYYDEYSVKEISELLNVKESTIQTRLLRGREKLRKYIRKRDDINEG